MFNLDNITKEDTKEPNPKWPGIPDHLYRIVIEVLHPGKQMHC